MADTTLEMVKHIDASKFPSHATKEHYDIIRELISILILLDGYKAVGEGAHKRMIEYAGAHYHELTQHEISLIDDLRVIRNKIAYDGFFVKKDYLDRNMEMLQLIIRKLKSMADKKLSSS